MGFKNQRNIIAHWSCSNDPYQSIFWWFCSVLLGIAWYRDISSCKCKLFTMKFSLYGFSPLCSLVIYKRTSLWKPWITLMIFKWLLPTVYYLMIYKTIFKINYFITLISFKWFPILWIFRWLIKLHVNAKHGLLWSHLNGLSPVQVFSTWFDA